jgi:uncharacterized membrane protein (DUF373 family)
MAIEQRNRVWVARVFTIVEDVVYLGLGLLRAGCSLTLFFSGIINLGQNLIAGSITTNIAALLDRILLIPLVVELLYTVHVSFREHALMPEPFLLIGLIAAIRRVLLLTAELAQVRENPSPSFNTSSSNWWCLRS